MRKHLIFGITSILLSSCAAILQVQELKPTDGTIQLKKSDKITLVSAFDLKLSNYEKTFHKHFINNDDFTNSYNLYLTKEIKDEKFLANINYDSTKQWSILSNFSGSKDDFNIIDVLYNKSDANYILLTSGIEINEKSVSHFTSNGKGGGTTTYTEYVTVQSKFKLIEKSTRKTIVEFTSNGESVVRFLQYKKALRRAIQNNVYNVCGFLKTGKKFFKKSSITNFVPYELKEL